MHHYEALQQLAHDRGDERRRDASAERLALAARAKRRSRRWQVALGAALRLRSPFAGKDERSPAYRPSA